MLKKIIKHIKWLLNSIINLYDYYKLVDDETYIFISHNGDSAGGAPVVLYELIKSINNDYKIVLLCKKPGSILDLCKTQKINALNCYLLEKIYIEIAVRKKVRLFFVNTVASVEEIKTIMKLTDNIPSFWWIHEEKNYLLKYKNKLPDVLTENIKVLSVSEKVKSDLISISSVFKEKNSIFFYGCSDLAANDEKTKRNNSKYVVSVIGRVCERKNQLQIIKAYDYLSQDIKDRLYVNFIYASFDEVYMENLKKLSKQNPHFIFVGPVERDNMKTVYDTSDLIICSSIDDPLPVVITEAMMLKCPFITSSHTGQYALIENGYNGFSYNVESDEALADCITQVYNCIDLENIVIRARQLYDENFTLDVVKKKFKAEIVNYSLEDFK